MSKQIQLKTENGVVDLPIDAVSVNGKDPMTSYLIQQSAWEGHTVNVAMDCYLTTTTERYLFPFIIKPATHIVAGVMTRDDKIFLDSVQGKLNAKQDTLVSGTNIATINNVSLLNGGDIKVADVNSLSVCQSNISNIKNQIKSSTSGNHSLTGYETLLLLFDCYVVNHIDIYIYPNTGTTGKISIGNILTDHIIELSHGMVHFEIDIYKNDVGQYVKFTSYPLQHASSIDMFYTFYGDLKVKIVAGEIPVGLTSSDLVYNICWKSF